MLPKENKLGAIKNGLRCLRGNIIVKKIYIGDITIKFNVEKHNF